jgi:glycosyltransferase involved in cell wall biosynthesis
VPTQAVLFIHHANDMYGADIGLLHSILCLDRNKYDPIVLLPSDMPTGMLSPELERLGVEYHFVTLGILRRKYLTASRIFPLIIEMLSGIAQVRSIVRRRNVALVYVNTFVTVSGAIGASLAQVPVLWHIREILTMPRVMRWGLTRTLNLCADRVVCISKAVRDSLLDEAPNLASKCVVVYNAVSAPIATGADKKVGIREELGLPESVPLVGMVGRISHWKGQEILVEAAAQVLETHPSVHFVAVGSYFADESHYLEKLRSQIESLGLAERFHLGDYRSNVTEVYRALDIFVLPSRKPEPFGRVTVEAMMQSRPVIATNHGGTCEIIEDGVTGMLVPPADPAALAEKIELLLTDSALRERLGQNAAVYAQENFSLLRYQRQLQEVIDAMALRDPQSQPADMAAIA